MAVIVIFVEGADTEPDPLPVYFLDNQDHATLICEGLKESEYRTFNFSFKHCTRSDRGRFAVWAEMTIDARDGVYGSIAAGIYDIIDRAHAIISGRRQREKPPQPPATGSDDAKGRNWQDIQAELELLRLKGEPYTSQEKLAKKIGCTKCLVQKALKNGPAELQDWASRQRAASRLNATPEATAVAFDSTPQGREVDPANAIDGDDVDAAMDYLLTQAGPHEQARINSMAPAEKRQLAETLYRDNDKEEQVERHRRAKRSRRD